MKVSIHETSEPSPSHDWFAKLRLAILICYSVVSALLPHAVTAESAIGPGVAGQVHALAYHPTDPNIIFAGGDNCGVYKSVDNGRTWERWNRGLSDSNPRMTTYVDDLLFVPAMAGVDPANVGLYAATRGGIAFLAEDATEWVVQTTDLNYDNGYAAKSGAAIPFNCLGFDPVTKTIYAGAGDGRITHENNWAVYPEVDDGSTEWSLWSKSLADGSPDEWTYVLRFGDKQTPLQIAFVTSPNDTSRCVVATTSGVYLQSVGGSDWDSILDEAIMCADFSCNYSHVAAGVGVGDNGVIWALTRRTNNHDPGVFRLIPRNVSGEYEYTNNWEEPGYNDVVEPQGTAQWQDIVHAWDDNDFKTLTVNPGTDTSKDEVFVGMEPAEIWTGNNQSYNGYFRYGECGDGSTRWVNILFRDGRLSWSDPDVPIAYATYADLNVQKQTIVDMGWLPGYPTGSTVQLKIGPVEDPDDNDEYADWLFASLYHYPLALEFGTGTDGWSQRYCDGSGDFNSYYESSGLNIMNANAVAFTSSGRLVVGCRDFLGFITQDLDETGSSGFRYMDPYYAAEKDCRDLEVIGDEVYMVRQGPIEWSADGTAWFGYDSIVVEGTTVCRQTYVIAKYEENINNEMVGGTAGYRWRYVSQQFDSEPFSEYIGDSLYEVVDIELVDANTMFAIVRGDLQFTVFRAHRDQVSNPWSWDVWWTRESEQQWSGGARKLLSIPGTERLLVITSSDICLFELSTTVSSEGGGFAPRVWIDRTDPELESSSRLAMSLRNLTNIACDPHGEWLYLTSNGQIECGVGDNGVEFPYYAQCANVLRARIPADGNPTDTMEWECILNKGSYSVPSDGIPFEAVDDAYWPDNLPTFGRENRAAENMPRIQNIAVHPDNPRRVFIGLKVGGFKAYENFHPRNGVWEFVPSGDDGQWIQRKGGTAGEPCTGVLAVELVPDNPTTLIAASRGQELFLVDGLAPSSAPVTAVTSLEAVHPEQTLLMLTLEGVAGDIAGVRVDASSWNIPAPVQLNDDGTGDDWEAGDGIWTASVAGYTAPVYGDQPLPVYVRDVDWNSFYGEVMVTVLEEAPAVFYRNVSPDVGFSYAGTPSGITPTDLIFDGEVDDQRDVFMSQFGDDAKVFRNNGENDGVPDLQDQTSDRFPSGQIPGQNHGPAVSVDLDADGLLDLIVPAGQNTGTSCLKFYRQENDEKFRLQPDWNPLSEPDQQGTWFASCGDYDGDGFVDIYLCRASSQDGLPGTESGALADILLRNNLAKSGTFVNATNEIDLGTAMVSVAAKWCDYDGDGDLDLAVAGATTGQGVQIYENDLDSGTKRFELVYPLDPANPTWTKQVADIAWTDIDSDGEFELVAATLDDPAEIHVFENVSIPADPVLLVTLPAAVSGFRVVDYDLDGDLDLMALPTGDDDPPRMLLNEAGVFTVDASPLGLVAVTGATNGALVTDLTGDGSAELFFGRRQQSNRFLCTAATPPPDSWVGVRLLDDSRGNAPAFGARVVFENGVIATVAGDGRTDHVIRLGIGADPDPTCDIYWPSGHVRLAVPLALNTVTTVYHQEAYGTDFEMSTVKALTELKPRGIVDYVFRWRTNKQTDLTADSVQLNQIELHFGDPGVAVSQWFEILDGEPVYGHELRWYDQVCEVANLPFSVTVRRGDFSLTSDQSTLRSKVCTPDPDLGSP